MMLSDGEMMKLTSHDEDKELFQAARLSLGALGVIVSLKLQCEPAFNLQQVQYSVPLKDVCASVVVKGNRVKEVDLYSAFIVVPHAHGAQIRITQCYLQITPYLPLPRKHSPDGASPD